MRLLVTGHFDKAEAFRAAGLPIHDDLGRLNSAVRLKQILQIAVGHPKRKVADVQLLGHSGPPWEKTPCKASSAQSGLLPSHENTFSCDLGREKCKRGDNSRSSRP